MCQVEYSRQTFAEGRHKCVKEALVLTWLGKISTATRISLTGTLGHFRQDGAGQVRLGDGLD